jgi:hypothetical protein
MRRYHHATGSCLPGSSGPIGGGVGRGGRRERTYRRRRGNNIRQAAAAAAAANSQSSLGGSLARSWVPVCACLSLSLSASVCTCARLSTCTLSPPALRARRHHQESRPISFPRCVTARRPAPGGPPLNSEQPQSPVRRLARRSDSLRSPLARAASSGSFRSYRVLVYRWTAARHKCLWCALVLTRANRGHDCGAREEEVGPFARGGTNRPLSYSLTRALSRETRSREKLFFLFFFFRHMLVRERRTGRKDRTYEAPTVL